MEGQIDDLIGEINQRTARKERVLVTTLTKKMAEDLTAYLQGAGIKVRYMHHDIDTIERMEIIRDLRLGTFDVLVGINLLREGLDLPEVSLVAILDADKEGFLRSETSLIQTIGRAARNADGMVIMYADTITPSMRRAMDETERRREKQDAFNKAHGIVRQPFCVGAHSVRPHRKFRLSQKSGKLRNGQFKVFQIIIRMFCVEKYVVMPNHIHLMLRIEGTGRTLCPYSRRSGSPDHQSNERDGYQMCQVSRLAKGLP